jgi:hypothetical protein
MKKRRRFLIGLAIVTSSFGSTAAFAQIIGDQQCKNPQYTASKVAEIRTSIARLNDAVEMVPPEEAEYIRAESKQAMAQQNRVRFNAVVKRHYYPALEFHTDAKVALDNLDAAKNATGKDLARYLVVVLSRLGELSSSMSNFMDADKSRPSPTLTDEMRQTMYYFLPSAKSQSVSLLQCVISVL